MNKGFESLNDELSLEARAEISTDRSLKLASNVLRRVFIPSEDTLQKYKELGVKYTIGGLLKI